MSFDTFRSSSARWEMQPFSADHPTCELLKVSGCLYPFGSIIHRGGFANKRYECHAFTCDDDGRIHTIWRGEVSTSSTDAKDAVVRAHQIELQEAA